MDETVRVCQIRDETEGAWICSVLDEKCILYTLKTMEDAAYDGLYVAQGPWGFIEASEEYVEAINQIVNDCRGSNPTSPGEGEPVDDASKSAYVEKVDQRGDIDVWLVDETYVRGHIDEEFTYYGQHYRYSDIPLNEFWIDQQAHTDERQFLIDHLLTEFKLMEGGVTYDRATAEADETESEERRRSSAQGKLAPKALRLPEEVHKELCRAR